MEEYPCLVVMTAPSGFQLSSYCCISLQILSLHINQPKAFFTNEGYHMIIANYIHFNQPKALVATEGYPLIITTKIRVNAMVEWLLGLGDKGSTLDGVDARHCFLCPECNCPFLSRVMCIYKTRCCVCEFMNH